MINLCKKIAEHIKEYCEAAAIHGPQHIVSQRLAIFERLASYVNLFPVKSWRSVVHDNFYSNTYLSINDCRSCNNIHDKIYYISH